MQVSKPTYRIIYNGKNISEDISISNVGLTYTDKVSGEADELEIRLEDKFLKWQNEWYPEKGATLDVVIGIDGKELSCGAFQIDEVEFTGPPDEITIKALSTGFYGKTRTRKSHAHENKTLSQIVHSIAAKVGYRVVGSIENVLIGRSTQNRESDLQYLSRLASEYGYNFTVKDKSLVFIKQSILEARATSIQLDKTETTSYAFKDKTSEIFKGSTIKFHNPNSNKVITSSRDAKFNDQDGQYTNQLDTLEIRGKNSETEEQANIKADAYIYRKTSLQQTGNLTCYGNALLISGNNIDLTGFGAFSGVWHILNSTHNITRDGGWITDIDIKRIRETSSPAKKKPKIQTITPTYQPKPQSPAQIKGLIKGNDSWVNLAK